MPQPKLVQGAPFCIRLHQCRVVGAAMAKRKLKKARLSVSVTEPQKHTLQEMADRYEVSLARVIQEAVKEFIENHHDDRLPLFERPPLGRENLLSGEPIAVEETEKGPEYIAESLMTMVRQHTSNRDDCSPPASRGDQPDDPFFSLLMA